MNQFSDRDEWERAGLKDFGEFADRVEFVNQREDGPFDCLRGEWYWGDDDSMTIYSGTFGNDNSPGASMYTYADQYDLWGEYLAALGRWAQKPEYLDE